MPYIRTEPVESSNIERIGYLHKQQILRIIFKGNRAYDYPMVTDRDWRDLMAAESKGKFINQRIKPLYAPRTPREAELVEPCCQHDDPNPKCTDECFPCNPLCCPGEISEASPEEIASAIRGGLAFGAADHSKLSAAAGAAPDTVENINTGNSGQGVQVGGDVAVNPTQASELVDSDDDTVIATAGTDEDEKACLHPNIESLADGSNPVCAACGVDLSQSGDCPHGADGRTCEEGCGCIPCHVTQDEKPEVRAHSKALNEMPEIMEEEEETNGNSD